MSIGDIVVSPITMVAPPLSTGCHRSMVLTILLAAQHKRARPALTPVFKYLGGVFSV